MSLRYYANAAPQQTLAAPINSSVTSCQVAGSFTGWPSQVPFVAALDIGTASFELVLVTAIVGTTATIQRHYDGTVAVSHAAGATLDAVECQLDFREANDHVNATANVHGTSGAVVGVANTQTLTNKTLTSPVINTPTITSPTTDTLTVTGALSGATAALSSTLSVTGLSTLTGGATIPGTLTVGGLAGGVVPPGVVSMYGAATAPTGYLLCDGAPVSRTTYANLFAVIGTSYGSGDGSSTFNVPSMTAKFPMQGAPGATGGASSHTHPLSGNGAAEIYMDATPSPNVFMRRVSTASWTDNLKNGFASAATSDSTAESLGAALTGATDSTSTLPPYLSFAFIIKT